MLRILGLGFNGFIGRCLTAALVEKENISVTIFSKDTVPSSDTRLKYIQGDFLDTVALRKALANQDIVYHLISQTIPSSSWNYPLLEVEKNLIPTLNLIELSAEANVKKICFASSGGTVYGLQERLLDEQSLTEPFSPYGIIKRAMESLLLYAKMKCELNYDIYRISNAYGEGQNVGKGLGFINCALENIIMGRPVIIYGDGENIRDYIYVKDIAELLTLSIYKPLKDSDIYNVSSGHPISLNALVNLMKDVLGIDFEVSYISGRTSDNKCVILNNAKIMNFFENRSLTFLEDGIKQTYANLKKAS